MFYFCHSGRRGPMRGRIHHRGPMGMRGGGGGVRRPLRFLIERLDLDDTQAAALSRALDGLRLEREQSQLDARRARSNLADQLEGETLDPAKVAEAAEVRVQGAKRERDAVVEALRLIHAALKPEQRTRLATLLRSGPFQL